MTSHANFKACRGNDGEDAASTASELDQSSDACLYCGDRPGRDVYHGICWICELGVLAGDLPKPNRVSATSGHDPD